MVGSRRKCSPGAGFSGGRPTEIIKGWAPPTSVCPAQTTHPNPSVSHRELVTQLPKIQKVWPLLKEGKIGALMRHTLLTTSYYFREKMKGKLRAVAGPSYTPGPFYKLRIPGNKSVQRYGAKWWPGKSSPTSQNIQSRVYTGKPRQTNPKM